MNRDFYIFRHGETDWNRERRSQGHTDIHLNELGILQAKELASKFKTLKIPLEIIYTSDLQRAHRTGATVATHLDIPLIIDHRLREMSYGEAEGLKLEETVERFGREFWNRLQSFTQENNQIGFPGGETRDQVRIRIESVLKEIISNTKYQNIALSTHGGALRNILHYFLPMAHPVLAIPNCVVYKMSYVEKNKKFIVDPNPI